ncbi:predicted protein [Sclerotinia sclerotiorum 1980 UF-70]|uniref:Uncharacterized protein n=2 Tax=Sclerotinia sclerotiorum (strain ATCC 18683 / 1980 / Ss-1) TaxID=665079 RepID=A7F8R8_SCLS1|nr:predicted protein [Sclerotinia sclerotiorum 1980 UF-70]APA13881.1 hypothetical protein sscle_11g086510 [Sclerotinia sclerotiorum 1980 UF-70]EDN99139.1 predicted protein [Sclerotinia sclerotiorum 1980 UF-70]
MLGEDRSSFASRIVLIEDSLEDEKEEESEAELDSTKKEKGESSVPAIEVSDSEDSTKSSNLDWKGKAKAV